MPNLKLSFFPGTSSQVALIGLEQSGAAFETVLINFAVGEHRSPGYLVINPIGKVPTLQIDGKSLTENVAILTWLSRTYPEARLLPLAKGLQDEVDALSDLSWCAATIHPIVTRLVLPQLFCDVEQAMPRVWELASEAMHWNARLLERRLSGQPWMLSKWSAVDAYVQWIWEQSGQAGFDTADYPYLQAHAVRHREQPAVQRALARERAAFDWLKTQGFSGGPPRPQAPPG